MGVVLQPLAEDPDGEPVPTVNFGTAGVIRCKRCRTYINPFVEFIDNGRRWRCNMCRAKLDCFFFDSRTFLLFNSFYLAESNQLF